MSRVYARRPHSYTDRATGVNYFFPEKSWIDVPDPIGRVVLDGHPDKLVDISGEDDPDTAVARLTAELRAVEPEPEEKPAEPEAAAETPAKQRRAAPRPRTTPQGTRGRG